MEVFILRKPIFNLFPILPQILLCILCLQNFASSKVAVATSPTNETDRSALLAFKNGITEDPLNIMSSWNISVPFCSWPGISCSKKHAGRVNVLKLSGMKLAGGLSPHIGNLSFLRGIYLTNNSFHGKIPQEIGRLSRLVHLNLSYNEFEGMIPSNLSYCLNLQVIQLHSNNFTGEIPRWLGNTTSLILLNMGTNKFHGCIPTELGRLSKLQYLGLSQNNVSGTIPPSFYNLSSLLSFNLALNQLQGRIAPDIGFRLANLLRFLVTLNQFSGPIPISLSNASGLQVIGFSGNSFTGTVPQGLGTLRSLRTFSVSGNQLGTVGRNGLSFFTSLTNCSNLQAADIAVNRFTGQLPASISNFSSTFSELLLGENQLSGTIPEGIEQLVGLTTLDINSNSITGKIPFGIGKLKELQVLSLNKNKLSGSIPSSLGNLTKLFQLFMFTNYLDGNIPSTLGNCQRLEVLQIHQNNLTGTIPVEITNLPMTISLSLSDNYLTGFLPSEVGNMSQLVELHVSGNKLSGGIPSSISNCLMMLVLSMEGNSIEGSIHSSLSRLTSMTFLNLSKNKLIGQFPTFLQNFTYLQQLDLSFNKLEGEVPTGGIFRNSSEFSIIGNSKLCGGIKSLGLPDCQRGVQNKKGVSLVVRVALPVTVSCLILLAGVGFILKPMKIIGSKISTMLPMIQPFPRITYLQLSRASNDFSSSNLIGEGSYGCVYKGTLVSDEMVVAVKVLNLKQKGAAKSFIAECNALRNIRHRNLVRVITNCSSIDSSGADFKAIVYEYMPNGSLASFLYRIDDEQLGQGNLSLLQRLSIAIDIASALEYLHHHCQPPIVHGDLKPSNVLLDHDMTARVGDFGLARILSETILQNSSPRQTSSTGIRGTVGYVAPEYGVGGKASTQGDVYSFGILLMELFTGKRPTDDIFTENINLHVLIKEALPERVTYIVEPSLLSEVGSGGVYLQNVEQCLTDVLRIGVFCSVQSPRERMEIREVVTEMCKIKDKLWSALTIKTNVYIILNHVLM